MTTNTFIDNAKVMSKGQVIIPKDVREVLGISSGDRVTFVVEAEISGLTTDEAVMDLVAGIRAESET